MNVILDLFCMGLVKLGGIQSKQKLQNPKFLFLVGFKPPSFNLETYALSITPRDLLAEECLKVNFIHDHTVNLEIFVWR